jgi:kynurenine formamidase
MALWPRIIFGIANSLSATGLSAAPATLSDAASILKEHHFVDLTHIFGPGIPHFGPVPDESVTTLYTVVKDGFGIQEFCHIGQWGIHVDPPVQFHPGLRTVDQIDPTEMVVPLVVIAPLSR